MYYLHRGLFSIILYSTPSVRRDYCIYYPCRVATSGVLRTVLSTV